MSTELESRERIIRAIERKDIDRIPFFFRADQSVNDMIIKHHGLTDNWSVAHYYHSDAVHVQPSFISESQEQVAADGTFYDIYGNKHRRVENNHYTTSKVIKPVLANATSIADLDQIRWPDPSNLDLAASECSLRQARETGLAVYSGIWATIFSAPKTMLGEEEFLVALLESEDFSRKLIERTVDYFIEVNELFFSKFSQYVDVFYFGSDFGTQNSLYISQELFGKFFKPGIARLARHAKGFGLKVMYHTCGAISDIIPDLIECGVDILDPVQVSAANMSPAQLAEKYKGKIVFHGGISTQNTLPFGTPEMVREEVINCLKTFGPLGYIAAPDQDMIGDIPLANIDMMGKTVNEYAL